MSPTDWHMELFSPVLLSMNSFPVGFAKASRKGLMQDVKLERRLVRKLLLPWRLIPMSQRPQLFLKNFNKFSELKRFRNSNNFVVACVLNSGLSW